MASVKIKLSSKQAGLLGFGRKSRQIFTGFEAVRRAVTRGNVVLILIDVRLSANSFKKIDSISRRSGIPICQVEESEEGLDLIGLLGYKIIALQDGNIAQGFIEKLKQESQWQ